MARKRRAEIDAADDGRPSRALIAAVVLGAIAAVAGVYFAFAPRDTVTGANPRNAEAVALGEKVYRANCASCHGVKLEGQSGWNTRRNADGTLPAPPHDKTGHTWHHPDEMLAGITKKGILPYAPQGYESDMPAFGAVLTDEQIAALWAYVKSTWPERERRYQAQMTRQSELPKQTQ